MFGNKIDVHIIQHPTQDRSATLEPLLEQLEKEPVTVHLIEGVDRMIGTGRAIGFRAGNMPLVSYVDDDDAIVPGIFSKILEAFEDEPIIDGLCTREYYSRGDSKKERPCGKPHWMEHQFPFKYYDHRHIHRIHHITCYKRESILSHLKFIEDIPTTSEHSLVAKLLLNDARIKHLPEYGYYWDEHDGSTPSLNMQVSQKSVKLYAEVYEKAQRLKFKSHIPEQGLIGR